MADTWGNLKKAEKQAIATRAKRLTKHEIDQRFKREEGRVKFTILRKTDRALAGPLDIDLPEDGSREALAFEMAEGVEEYESTEVVLIPPEEFDYEPQITATDQQAAQPVDKTLEKLTGYFAQDRLLPQVEAAPAAAADAGELPAVVDHRNRQSPVKNQGGRGTCVSHASLGLLEAFEHIPDDLSEQYTHYKFMEFQHQPHNQDIGLKTTDAAPFLARPDGRVCLEAHWPYISDQPSVNAMVANGTYQPPQKALDNQKYGYSAYKIISDQGLTGESIKNTRYLEALLYQGYDIVIGTWVSWDDKDNNGILDPVLDPNGKPIGQGGHAMLVVGYNRTEQYFIVKNSWGGGWGHNGYAYFHYNLIRSCFKYGFVIDTVEPPALTQLPRKLATAPFSTAKVSRAQLQTAVLFVKTSQGRFAVCEAAAGNNLLLRNIKAYNADGTLHLQKDSLVIHSGYLCDMGTAQETSQDADLLWEVVSPGVNFLVPRNNAALCVAYDLAALTPQAIEAIPLASAAIPAQDLSYAVVVGRTTSNRRFKLLVNALPGNQLLLSYVEVYNANGKRCRYALGKKMAPPWTYNLDTLQMTVGQAADIWWHVTSDSTGFLEAYSTARIQLLWSL